MIFITGLHGAGKTFLAKHLCSQDFHFLDTGPAIKDYWKKNGDRGDFKLWIKNNQERDRNFTNKILVDIVGRKVKDLGGEGCRQDLLVVGHRSVEGVNYLTENVPELNSRKHTVVWIEADRKSCYRRYVKRENVDISFTEFDETLLRMDEEMGLCGLRDIADHIIVNNGSEEEFGLKIEGLIYNTMGIEKSFLGSGKERR